MQLTKAYVAETSCSQLLLLESATYYIRTYMLKINLLVINNVAMSLSESLLQ